MIEITSMLPCTQLVSSLASEQSLLPSQLNIVCIHSLVFVQVNRLGGQFRTVKNKKKQTQKENIKQNKNKNKT